MVLHSQLADTIAKRFGQLTLCCPASAADSLAPFACNGNAIVLGVPYSLKNVVRGQLSEARRYLREPIQDNAALWSRHLYYCNGSTRLLHRAQSTIYYLGHRLLYGNAFAHRCFDALDRTAHRSREINAQFREMKPDVVVSTYPISAFETSCLFEAKDLGIPTVGHLLSWDNITCKGRFAAPPDYYLSWGPVMSEELQEVYGVPPGRIFECGVPHFDEHKRLADAGYRAMVIRQLGLRADRPYLLFGMSAPIFSPHEIDVVEWLAAQVNQGRFGREMQLIIRPHPQNVLGNMADPSWLPRLEALRSDRVALNKPLLLDGGLQWGMETEDMKVLVNLLAGCSVCLNSGSTLSIDALIHDKPVVVTLFDADRELPWWQSARRIREFPHYRKLLAMGGVQAVGSYAQLADALNKYLQDQRHDRDGRARTVASQCGIVDGNASSRAADAILRILTIDNSGKSRGAPPFEEVVMAEPKLGWSVSSLQRVNPSS
jgi:hypothetical protein